MKVLIFDSGPLINLSMNGLLYILEKLKSSNLRFIITPAVKYEIIDKPSGIPRFELGALKVKSLLDSKILEMPESIDIDQKILNDETKILVNKANHFMQSKGEWLRIVSEAEMSCLALSSILTKKGIENMIAIDERTTRILAEKPETLEELMSHKLHQKVKIVENIKLFSKFKFIRSSELVYVAYKKNLIDIKGQKVLEALIYATKFHGSSISWDEINELKKL